MKKLTLGIAILVSFLLSPNNLVAQADNLNRSVGIVPFSGTCTNCNNIITELQQIAVSVLSSKKHITAIDRSTDTLLNKEIEQQKEGTSLYSEILVEQGKKLGAQDIVTGTITNLDVQEKQSVWNDLLSQSNTKTQKTNISYKVLLSFSLSIIDVETGKVKASKIFELSPNILSLLVTEYSTTEDALNNVIRDNRDNIYEMIDDWVNKTYPARVKFYSIVERTKKGLPKTVLIAGASEANIKVGAEVIINKYEEVALENKIAIHRKQMGLLQVKELQGDFTLCKVMSGEDVLEGLINAKQIELVIK